jgi:hypothetical protein
MEKHKKNIQKQKSAEKTNTRRDHAGLTFSGYVKIFDPNTKKVFVEKRS